MQEKEQPSNTRQQAVAGEEPGVWEQRQEEEQPANTGDEQYHFTAFNSTFYFVGAYL